MSCFYACGQFSKKKHIVFSYNKSSKICFSMHFGSNNQFIKATRTRLIFQKFQKKLFYFLLTSRITNLYVRCIPNKS
jgi:hypothetical protein